MSVDREDSQRVHDARTYDFAGTYIFVFPPAIASGMLSNRGGPDDASFYFAFAVRVSIARRRERIRGKEGLVAFRLQIDHHRL